MWVKCKNIFKASPSFYIFVLWVNKLNLTVDLDITDACVLRTFDWWKIIQCLEIQVGHLGWDSLQGRTLAFRHILGDVCVWDDDMLIEVSAFLFGVVCTAQCKSLKEKSVQWTDRGCHGTSCCPNLCFWYTSECHGLQQLCQENTDLEGDLHQNCQLSCRYLGHQRASQMAPDYSA